MDVMAWLKGMGKEALEERKRVIHNEGVAAGKVAKEAAAGTLHGAGVGTGLALKPVQDWLKGAVPVVALWSFLGLLFLLGVAGLIFGSGVSTQTVRKVVMKK